MLTQNWQSDQRYGTLLIILCALAIWVYGRQLTESLLTWCSIRYFPDGRLRRSFLTLVTGLTSVLSAVIVLNLVSYAFTQDQPLPAALQEFHDGFISLAIFCALLLGLGRALLSVKRPSWRLAPIGDEEASRLRYFPSLLATLFLVFGTINEINTAMGVSFSLTVIGNGMVAIFISLSVLLIPLRIYLLRRQKEQAGESQSPLSVAFGIASSIMIIAPFAVIVSLVTGYTTFAIFIVSELIWATIILLLFYFLSLFFSDLCAAFYSVDTASGRWLKCRLGIHEKQLEPMAIITSALVKCSLLFLAAVALLNGTFGNTTPGEVLEKTAAILTGDGLKKLHLVPANVFNAVLCLVIGIYILRTIHRWLEKVLLPKTSFDEGIRASMVTLFTNIGYVAVILLTLAALGVQWKNLTWIVSALSVGIGFGLQEIVKNFFSGLILLTERPVKVGDMISVGTIEGDVKRINVRATEIQLGDRSTVIVPNSQLISQNVRNATMANAQGVVTITVTFPVNTDPDQVSEILIAAYAEHEGVMTAPAPFVRFSALGIEGITLSITGIVQSPRMVGATRSELLFNIFRRLRYADVELATP